MSAPPLLALVGPTASGKTDAALAIAPGLGAEILCVDSMTVYRGMQVGTAKPTPEQRSRVLHHLLDLRDPAEPFSVAEFQRAARDAIADVRSRSRTPLLVGGSGLYFRAVLDDLSFPPTDPAVRARIEAEPAATARRRLEAADPAAAARIDPRNRRRVVRALEVIEITGRPFSEFGAEWGSFDAPAIIAGLDVPAAVLRERIERRATAMVESGLLEETRSLLARGYRDALTAPQAIPYRRALAVLDGTMEPHRLAEEIARAERRLARRQMAWFRRDPRVRWFDGSDIEAAKGRIAAYYREHVPREAARR